MNSRNLCQAVCTERIDDILHVLREPREPRTCSIFIFRLNGDDWTVRVLIRRRNLGNFGNAGQMFHFRWKSRRADHVLWSPCLFIAWHVGTSKSGNVCRPARKATSSRFSINVRPRSLLIKAENFRVCLESTYYDQDSDFFGGFIKPYQIIVFRET